MITVLWFYDCWEEGEFEYSLEHGEFEINVEHLGRNVQLFKQVRNKNGSYRCVSHWHRAGINGNQMKTKKSFGGDKNLKKKTPGKAIIQSEGEREELKGIPNCIPFTSGFISRLSICSIILYLFQSWWNGLGSPLTSGIFYLSFWNILSYKK